MIINCRPSEPNKFVVRWIGKEKSNFDSKGNYYRVARIFLVDMEKIFDTFADADGFARGMQKKGNDNILIERF